MEPGMGDTTVVNAIHELTSQIARSTSAVVIMLFVGAMTKIIFGGRR